MEKVMNLKVETGCWSNWIDWPVDRDPMAVPQMLRPGDWVEADLMLRPHPNSMAIAAKYHDRPHMMTDTFELRDGTAFMLIPPEPVLCSHMVINRFRYLRISEEELLDLLIGVAEPA